MFLNSLSTKLNRSLNLAQKKYRLPTKPKRQPILQCLSSSRKNMKRYSTTAKPNHRKKLMDILILRPLFKKWRTKRQIRATLNLRQSCRTSTYLKKDILKIRRPLKWLAKDFISLSRDPKCLINLWALSVLLWATAWPLVFFPWIKTQKIPSVILCLSLFIEPN